MAVLSVVLAIGVVLALGVLQRRIGTRAPWLTTRSRDGSRWTPLLVLLIGAVILANALFWLAVLTIRLVD